MGEIYGLVEVLRNLEMSCGAFLSSFHCYERLHRQRRLESFQISNFTEGGIVEGSSGSLLATFEGK